MKSVLFVLCLFVAASVAIDIKTPLQSHWGSGAFNWDAPSASAAANCLATNGGSFCQNDQYTYSAQQFTYGAASLPKDGTSAGNSYYNQLVNQLRQVVGTTTWGCAAQQESGKVVTMCYYGGNGGNSGQFSSSEEWSTNGGSSNGQSTNGGSSNGQSTNGGSSNGQSSNGGSTNGATALSPTTSGSASSNPTSTGVATTTGGNTGGSIDWRNMNGNNYVTSVKNQLECGCCWAFATASVIESLMIKSKGASTSLDLSEQQMVDCSTQNQGCGGGWPSAAIDYAAQAGLNSEADYPYQTSTYTNPPDPNNIAPFQCSAKSTIAAKPNSHVDVNTLTKEAFLAALAISPLAISINAQDSLQNYGGGVLQCSPQNTINHAVTMVGYDAPSNSFIIKNSWGTDWGNGGYFNVDADTASSCDIYYQAPSYPQ